MMGISTSCNLEQVRKQVKISEEEEVGGTAHMWDRMSLTKYTVYINGSRNDM